MKKQKVKKKLYEIRVAIINEIEEPKEELEEFITRREEEGRGSMMYGYKVGMSQAAMILLDKIYEMFPEEKDED